MRHGQSASRLPEAAQAVADAERRLAAGRSLLALRNELVVAQLDLNHSVAGRQALTEELLTLQQARIDGMAAELAGRLAVGGSCPVCGSDHHPHPATPAADAPDAAAERALRRRLADAEVETVARADRASALETQAAVAEQAAGTDDTDLLDEPAGGGTRRSDRRPSRPQTASLALEGRLADAEAGAAATTRSPDAADRPPRRARRVARQPCGNGSTMPPKSSTRCSATTTPTWPPCWATSRRPSAPCRR